VSGTRSEQLDARGGERITGPLRIVFGRELEEHKVSHKVWVSAVDDRVALLFHESHLVRDVVVREQLASHLLLSGHRVQEGARVRFAHLAPAVAVDRAVIVGKLAFL